MIPRLAKNFQGLKREFKINLDSDKTAKGRGFKSRENKDSSSEEDSIEGSGEGSG